VDGPGVPPSKLTLALGQGALAADSTRIHKRPPRSLIVPQEVLGIM
jgi:hypothetical protein